MPEKYTGGQHMEGRELPTGSFKQNLRELCSVDVLRAEIINADVDDSRVMNGDLLRNKRTGDELLLLARSADEAELKKLIHLFQKVEEYKKSQKFLEFKKEREESNQEMGSESGPEINEHIAKYVFDLLNKHHKDATDSNMFNQFPTSMSSNSKVQSIATPHSDDFQKHYRVYSSDDENVRRSELDRVMKRLLYLGGPFYPSEIEGRDKEGGGNAVFDRFALFERRITEKNPLGESDLQDILGNTNK